MQFFLRSCRRGAAALGVTGLGAAALTLAAFPIVAQGAVAAVTSVSCSVTGSNWCISGNNSSSGIGVIGTSKSGTGLRGASTSQYGLKATSGSNDAIFAQTTSGSSAITVLGSSKGNGVNASAGSVGLSGTSTGSGEGVLGYSKAGTGVYGISSTGTAGYFSSGSFGNGIQVVSEGGIAMKVTDSNGYGGEFEGTTTGLLGIAPPSGYPLAAVDSNSNDLFSVDGHGNVTYSGTLSSMAKIGGGGRARSFSPNSTQPTVEDTGTAQLVRGAAVVRLDSTFARSIEPTLAYRVFVTPGGETNGLFVTGKTAAGFIVRESHAGRSSVTFDYRIVATALGAGGQHMAMVSPAAMRALMPQVPKPVAPAAKVPARLPVPAGEPATP